jgi:hypothetical protein
MIQEQFANLFQSLSQDQVQAMRLFVNQLNIVGLGELFYCNCGFPWGDREG